MEFRSSSARTLNVKVAKASADHPGIWQLTIDLAAELGNLQQTNKIICNFFFSINLKFTIITIFGNLQKIK